MRSSKSVAGIAMALLLLAGTGASAAEEAKSNPWAGSSITYGQSFSAISLDKSAEQTWNPYYAHNLSLAGRWKFHDFFGVGLTFAVDQEMTDSDDTVRRYEWLSSDLLVDLNAGKGYTEAFTGIRVNGGVRVVLPTSKLSHARTMMVGVGPGLSLSRKFSNLFGSSLALSIGYNGRWSYGFHESKTAQYDRPTISACGDPDSEACEPFKDTGWRNAEHSIVHGPTLALEITDKLSFSTSFARIHSFLYELSAYTMKDGAGQTITLGTENDEDIRYGQSFSAEVSYQAIDALGIALGVSSSYGDLGLDGRYRTVLLNRFTNVYFNLSLDIDSMVNRFQ